MQVTDSFDLPAETGFVVITGQVEADGLTANPDDYFRPRTAPLTVTGNGYIVLVNANVVKVNKRKPKAAKRKA